MECSPNKQSRCFGSLCKATMTRPTGVAPKVHWSWKPVEHGLWKMLKVLWLSACKFCQGERYFSKALQRKCPHPLVLQNNYYLVSKWFTKENGIEVTRPAKIIFKHRNARPALLLRKSDGIYVTSLAPDSTSALRASAIPTVCYCDIVRTNF